MHAITAALQMKDAIEKELKAANLQNINITVTKIIQLSEAKNSRCVIIIYVCMHMHMYKLYKDAHNRIYTQTHTPHTCTCTCIFSIYVESFNQDIYICTEICDMQT